ncbi:MAG TPA: AAA family ATPase [Bacteroidales bacterium]|nr:AAA family ATPase [Bacteroidales bacterium]
MEYKNKIMTELFETSDRLIRSVPVAFTRYLFSKINWGVRLVEIAGSRGVGKTTLLLQRAKELNGQAAGQALFVSLDDPWFYSHSLIDTAAEYVRNGGRVLLLDEVHKYPNKHPDFDWSSELKTIYDHYPSLQVVYTSSSLLRLYKGQGDLSRRKTLYNLKGLSFREYLAFYEIGRFPPVTIDELLSRHSEVSSMIVDKIRIIPHFKKYLNTGYYPFYPEAPDQYVDRLKSVINVIVENDLPAVADISYDSLIKIKKLLAVIASSVPYTPNLSRIRQELFISDQRTLLNYLNYLDQAELITVLSREARGNQLLRKPDKIYLNNSNLLGCFSNLPDTGTIRETFFLNQVSNPLQVNYPVQGDFLVNGTWTFEVGGRTKTREQIKDVQNAFLALDDVETGTGQTIPLWLFGFLY